jgi:hypothetical protein
MAFESAWTTKLLHAFALLSFDFQQEVKPDGLCSVRGFGKAAVVEISGDPNSSVSLLFSITNENRGAAWSAVCLTTLADTVEVQFMDWLAGVIRTQGVRSAWVAECHFGDVLVSARYLSADAALLTLSVDPIS